MISPPVRGEDSRGHFSTFPTLKASSWWLEKLLTDPGRVWLMEQLLHLTARVQVKLLLGSWFKLCKPVIIYKKNKEKCRVNAIIWSVAVGDGAAAFRPHSTCSSRPLRPFLITSGRFCSNGDEHLFLSFLSKEERARKLTQKCPQKAQREGRDAFPGASELPDGRTCLESSLSLSQAKQKRLHSWLPQFYAPVE